MGSNGNIHDIYKNVIDDTRTAEEIRRMLDGSKEVGVGTMADSFTSITDQVWRAWSALKVEWDGEQTSSGSSPMYATLLIRGDYSWYNAVTVRGLYASYNPRLSLDEINSDIYIYLPLDMDMNLMNNVVFDELVIAAAKIVKKRISHEFHVSWRKIAGSTGDEQ